jgi:glutamyl endopeptidase
MSPMIRGHVRAVLALSLLAGGLLAAQPAAAQALPPGTTVSNIGGPVAAPATGRPGRSAVANPPGSAVATTESIIGGDDRSPVANTMAFPHRAVVLITLSGNLHCTGSLIDPDTVLTAGHCVYQQGGTWFPAGQLRVWPGYDRLDSPQAPFGSCGARSLHTFAGWSTSFDDRYDIGAIKLDCSVGASTGYLGWWWQKASLLGKPTTITGYPGDKLSTMWTHKDSVRVSQDQRVYYANDTLGGSSGSPVMMRRGSSNARCAGWCLMAVHAYGVGGGTYPDNTYNHGARITRAVSDALFYWTGL